MIKKKIISIFLILMMILSIVFISESNLDYSYADDSEMTEEELKELIEQLNNDLDDLIDENDAIGAEITSLANELSVVKEELDALNVEINEINTKIIDKQEELVQKQAEIDEQEDNLNARLRAMYKNGSIGYLDVLLGSNSISEFVYNMKLVKIIHKHDVEVVTILEDEYIELETIKTELEEAKAELDYKKEVLLDKQKDYEARVSVLQEKQAEYDTLIAEKKEEVKANMELYSGYVGGDFVWPLPSWSRHEWFITSWVGWRLHPIYGTWKYHGGTDIAVGSGQPIYACGNGTVIKSAWYTTYGYCVMIDHGGGIVSLYGHCSKLCCSKGDVVAAGDKIAEVGMTGAATGPHLHFEVMIDGVEQDSMIYYPDIEAHRPSDVIL